MSLRVHAAETPTALQVPLHDGGHIQPAVRGTARANGTIAIGMGSVTPLVMSISRSARAGAAGHSASSSSAATQRRLVEIGSKWRIVTFRFNPEA